MKSEKYDTSILPRPPLLHTTDIFWLTHIFSFESKIFLEKRRKKCFIKNPLLMWSILLINKNRVRAALFGRKKPIKWKNNAEMEEKHINEENNGHNGKNG